MSPSRLAVLFIGVAVVLLNLMYLPGNNLSWDVFGYYLYLPLTFIYQDLGLQNEQLLPDIISQYGNTSTLYQAVKSPNDQWVMKYSMGMAILYLPFFFIGHVLALLTDFPADGFSRPYQMAILGGGMLYTLAGFHFLRKVLLHFVSERITALTLLGIFLGTNLLFHVSFHGQNAMSHNMVFTAYALILYLTIRWHEQHRLKHMLALAVVCGLSILARPSEIVCLLIPLLWGVTDLDSAREKINLLLQERKQVIGFAGILLAIGSLQFIYWKLYTGSFLYYSYGGNAGEGFEFFSPYTWQVLFSFRKGWLIYTPLMFAALAGLVLLYRQHRHLFYALGGYFVCNLYFVSSWSCWWYAESFSQRSLIQSYAVLAIPLAFVLHHLFNSQLRGRMILLGGIGALLVLNLFQTWQFSAGIIHPSRMTAAYYWKVFGQTRVSEEDQKLLLIDRGFAGKEEFSDTESYTQKELAFQTFDAQEEGTSTDYAFSAPGSFQLTKDRIYSPPVKVPYRNITAADHAWIRVSAMVYPVVNPIENPSSLVVHFEHKGYSYKYKALDFEKLDLKVNEWNRISFDYLTPEVRKKSNPLKALIWHRGTEPVYIDDFRVEVFEPKD